MNRRHNAISSAFALTALVMPFVSRPSRSYRYVEVKADPKVWEAAAQRSAEEALEKARLKRLRKKKEKL